jgi:hypothetical protein
MDIILSEHRDTRQQGKSDQTVMSQTLDAVVQWLNMNSVMRNGFHKRNLHFMIIQTCYQPVNRIPGRRTNNLLNRCTGFC